MVIGVMSVSMYIDFFFFFKQKTAYEIGTGDWSSDVCSSDLNLNWSPQQIVELNLELNCKTLSESELSCESKKAESLHL